MQHLRARAVAAAVAPQVIRPPPHYDHKRLLKSSSLEIVKHRYPELEDLVVSGGLLNTSIFLFACLSVCLSFCIYTRVNV